jgi:phosphoribosyl 1,2-cyclic phosphate phosphodiesterase
MRVTILGCGAASGVPVWGRGWGVCDSENPKNHRLRASIWIQLDGKSILIDSGPDLRQQALTHEISTLDCVLYTHAHADHINGINDLRFISRAQNKILPIYGSAETLNAIEHSFSYAFEAQVDTHSHHMPFLKSHVIDGPFRACGVPIVSFVQDHGGGTTLGYRIGNSAYSTDVVALDDVAFEALAGIDVWIVDCLREAPSATHAHLALTLEWIARVRPKLAVLTHMGHELDYETLCAKLPAGVVPAYDGFEIEIS